MRASLLQTRLQRTSPRPQPQTCLGRSELCPRARSQLPGLSAAHPETEQGGHGLSPPWRPQATPARARRWGAGGETATSQPKRTLLSPSRRQPGEGTALSDTFCARVPPSAPPTLPRLSLSHLASQTCGPAPGPSLSAPVACTCPIWHGFVPGTQNSPWRLADTQQRG